MKLIVKIVAGCGLLALSAQADVVTNFYADFNAATAQDLKALTDNAARNTALGAGTAVGSWNVLANPNKDFKIVDNGSGNKAVVYNDGGLAVRTAVADGLFAGGTQTLTGGKVMTVTFNWMKTDVGGGGNDHAMFEMYDATNGLVSAIRWNDGTATGGPLAHSETVTGDTGYSLFGLDVDKDMSSSGAYNAANMIGVKVELSLAGVVYSFDTDLNGTYDVVSSQFAISKTDVAKFKLVDFSNQITSNQGAWVDDIVVTTIPEPATLGLVVATGASLVFIRRRLML